MVYKVTHRLMKQPIVRGRATPGHWIEVVCFTQPDIDGSYFSEREYRAIYRFAPSIQAAFETLDKALGEARDQT
jgi:hypothetical protein